MQVDTNEEENIPANLIEMEYFTDPLCCWSWAFEPIWRKFLDKYRDSVSWRYRMGGLLPDWKKYHDPLNDISKPAHMGPYWMQVRQITGIPIDENIWAEDPPQSSFPACIAVKCAELQSAETADLFLQALRRAVMTQKRNISKRENIISIAEEVEMLHPGKMNSIRFELDLLENKGIEPFKEDLAKAGNSNIGRYPAIVMKKAGGNGIILIGYRPYAVLEQTFEKFRSVYETTPKY